MFNLSVWCRTHIDPVSVSEWSSVAFAFLAVRSQNAPLGGELWALLDSEGPRLRALMLMIESTTPECLEQFTTDL